MYFTQLNTTILSCRSVPVSQMSVCYFLLLDLEQMSDRSFSLSQMKYFWRGAGRRKFKGKAEGWWRLARFFLIVRSQTSLASFAVPSATRAPWRWKGSRQIGPPMSTLTSWAHFAKNRSLDESDLLCQRRNHLQVFSTSCCPHLARISLTFAFTWLRFT